MAINLVPIRDLRGGILLLVGVPAVQVEVRVEVEPVVEEEGALTSERAGAVAAGALAKAGVLRAVNTDSLGEGLSRRLNEVGQL